MNTTGSVEIERPINEVFQLTVDHVAEWSLIVVSDEIIKETEDVIGTTFRTVTEERGNRMEFLGTVTTFEPPYRHAAHLVGKAFDIFVDYEFEQIYPHRTRVTQTSQVNARGVLKILFFLLGKFLKKSSEAALQKELNSLKEFCEQSE